MSSQGAKKRAIIIGGSMGGLFAGLHLLKDGWEVDIFERVPVPLSGRGAGIVTHEELLTAMGGVGIDTGRDLGVDVEGRVTFARDGSVIERSDLPQLLTSWGRLYAVLQEAFPDAHYHRGRDYIACEQEEGRVLARFSDGSEVAGDLLIGADGFRSTVRGAYDPDCQPHYAGYVAWRGLVIEHELSERVREEMFPYFAFCLPPSEQILGYPVAGENNDMSPGNRRYNFVWYRPAEPDQALPALLTDIDGACNGVSIAPDRIRPAVIEDMRTASEALLSPQFAELVAKTRSPFLQPIYDLGISSMAFGHVAILGDAAFVARPHVGMGVTKAAGDAVSLARHLRDQPDDVGGALKAFDAERHPVGATVVQRARSLGAYMQAQLDPAEQALAEKHRTPTAVMAETATSDFLDAPAAG
ncbi:MAG: FAD binding domain-containing protein [Devosia sp.]